MLKIKDKTFDYKKFEYIFKYLEPLILAEKLCGNEITFEVKNGGQNYMGYIHVVNFKKNSEKGFNLYLYENQSLKEKGFFAFRMNSNSFNKKQEKSNLKSLGFNKVDIKKGYGCWIVAISISNLMEQIDTVISKYREHIF